MTPSPRAGSAWKALAEHVETARSQSISQLFATDPGRGTALTTAVGDLYIDYSKHLVSRETLSLLLDLARERGVENRRDAMFAGAHINTTEDRAVLHTALRLPADHDLTVDGQNVTADVHEVLGRMSDLAGQVRGGEWTGATGQPITDVINIGIGGSDLGRPWPLALYAITATARRRISSPTSTRQT